MSERATFLASTELFTGVPTGTLERIVARFEVVHLHAGEALFNEGEPGDAVYLVEAGQLSLRSGGVEVLTRRRGECVGEFALLDEQPRSTAALAATDVRLLRLGRTDFQAAMTSSPEIARGIFRMLTGKLRQEVERKVAAELEQVRWRQDLVRAHEIQTGMLPPAILRRPDLAVAGYCHTAEAVGGDYYDRIELPSGEVALVVADVTGHAFYSGMFAAMAKSCLHVQVRVDHTPAAVLEALARTLALSIEPGLLMTCCYVVLDPAAGRLCFANAGHPYGYLRRAGDEAALTRLAALDPLLGVDAPGVARHQVCELTWRPGDLLVLYSDGITEAQSPDGDRFGHVRLEACIQAAPDGDPEQVRDAILAALCAYTGGRAAADDRTLVVARAL